MKNPNSFCLLIIFFLSLLSTSMARAESYTRSAVVLMYHRFGEDKYPSTNIRMDQLEKHIEELSSEKYNVVDLAELVDAIQSGQELPNRTVAITIDDGFKSVYTKGWPAFKKAGLPVTLFLSGSLHSGKRPDYLTWEQINEMVNEGLSIGGHGNNHTSLAKMTTAEASQLIINEYQILSKNLPTPPTLFAYPFGEAQSSLYPLLEELGYKAAFGQHSGAMTASHEQFYLPRFPINERYGEMDRLNMSLNTVGLEISDMVPTNPAISYSGKGNPPSIGFTISENLSNAHHLTCYHSAYGKIENIQKIGKQRIELRFDEKFNRGRTRINCTLPAAQGRWYWYGMQFITY